MTQRTNLLHASLFKSRAKEFVLRVHYATTQELFFLVAVFAKAFFTLVGSHLVAFSFLSAWHVVGIYFV
ncbi:hypothetical protein [Duncaniella sp.]|uniref:hypothetical protein n=1 Tax=Duncaniella sp. TaxID=2518496 RepID=UPI0023C7D2C7|nr:hypothetical protein [Duncaniella sp.]MDE5904824.1 hypothetical protein [Duncaniella sp.]